MYMRFTQFSERRWPCCCKASLWKAGFINSYPAEQDWWFFIIFWLKNQLEKVRGSTAFHILLQEICTHLGGYFFFPPHCQNTMKHSGIWYSQYLIMGNNHFLPLIKILQRDFDRWKWLNLLLWGKVNSITMIFTPKN